MQICFAWTRQGVCGRTIVFSQEQFPVIKHNVFRGLLVLSVEFCVIHYFCITRSACVLRSLFPEPWRGASAALSKERM
jgi:hypothetical protein